MLIVAICGDENLRDVCPRCVSWLNASVSAHNVYDNIGLESVPMRYEGGFWTPGEFTLENDRFRPPAGQSASN